MKSRVRGGTTAYAEGATPVDAERGWVHKELAAVRLQLPFGDFVFGHPMLAHISPSIVQTIQLHVVS